MKTSRLVSWFVVGASILAHTPSCLYCDSAGNESQAEQQFEQRLQETPIAEEESAEPQGVEVSPAPYAANKAKSRETIKNLILAGVAVVVAVVSILVVANNNGKKK